ncbi:MAG TPA: TlpA disulfide reductase family protein [Myxococcaceae bacterium]|nr:TlpA disulfide reductase family protein [Myxococcaceae bacterium]
MNRVGALLVLALGCAGSAPAPASSSTQPLTAASGPSGASVSDISLQTYPTPGKHAFSDDRGQVVVLDAWATWCAPCVRSLPELQALRKEYASRGVRVYAVSVDEDKAQIPTFLAAARVDVPVLLDPGGFVLESKLKLKQMPTTWVVDRSGHVRYTQESFDGNLNEVRAQVDALLREGP